MGDRVKAMEGRTYLERGRPVVVLLAWGGKGPRNVLIRRDDGTEVVRPFRGLRNPSPGKGRDLAAVLAEVGAERDRQDRRWGEQNHPDGTGQRQDIDKATSARQACADSAAAGHITWAHIFREEAYEALAEADLTALRAELIQVAAVAVAWVQSIDRRD